MLKFSLFTLFILLLVGIDLKNPGLKKPSLRNRYIHSLIWIGIALTFGVGVFLFQGREESLEFVTCYLVELSLSVDNLFAFILVFHYFHTPEKLQNRILFWGIIGALFFRLSFILGGIYLIQNFNWITYIFGGLLLASSFLVLEKHDEKTFCEPWLIVRLKKLFPIAHDHFSEHFFVKKKNKLYITTFFITLIAIELSDLFFAFDSVPAVCAITSDSFIAFTSNAFAIIGLRSLYTIIQSWVSYIKYLHYGVFVALIFIGSKMLLHYILPIDVLLSLAILVAILVCSVIASFVKADRS